MKVIDKFHNMHYENLKMERELGKKLPPQYSGIGSTHKIYMFDNGYGASVVNGFMSYDTDELAVLRFNRPDKVKGRSKKKRHVMKRYKKAEGYNLYDGDVTRYDDPAELSKELNRISRLSPNL